MTLGSYIAATGNLPDAGDAFGVADYAAPGIDYIHINVDDWSNCQDNRNPGWYGIMGPQIPLLFLLTLLVNCRFNKKTFTSAHEYCTLANIFGDVMNNDTSDPYKGIIWGTFRDVKHSMSKLVVKMRPSAFSTSSKIVIEAEIW